MSFVEINGSSLELRLAVHLPSRKNVMSIRAEKFESADLFSYGWCNPLVNDR
jgi:hypothetical protein